MGERASEDCTGYALSDGFYFSENLAWCSFMKERGGSHWKDYFFEVNKENLKQVIFVVMDLWKRFSGAPLVEETYFEKGELDRVI